MSLIIKAARNAAGVTIALAAVFFYMQSLQAAEVDSDGDGLSDTAETATYATDPAAADTDGDGFKDGDEVTRGYSPRHGGSARLTEVDSDKDYLPDAWEIALGTGLTNPDFDGDKFLDGTEVRAGYDPRTTARTRLEKSIAVDIFSQKLTYSLGGVALESFPISSGLPGTPTPTGEFSVLAKVPVKHYGGSNWSYPNTKWNLHFATKNLRYYIHGAYWHNDFGKPKSHGCVNVSYSNMERLYQWAQVGTKVKIAS